jgi:hypothetical protein
VRRGGQLFLIAISEFLSFPSFRPTPVKTGGEPESSTPSLSPP